MRFSRISITSKGVELDYVETDGDAKDETTHSNHMPPLGSFRDALQGFTSYVVDLIPFLEPIRESLTVTTLNLSEDKNGLRGLVVTALHPVEKAYGRPLVINTPLVREGGELPLEGAFVLSEHVLELIALAESEARRYKNKEYGELVAAKPDSENTKNANDRMAAAEVASTKKPKGRGAKARGAASAEPTPLRDLTDVAVRQLLASVDRDVPIEAIMAFSNEERAAAIRWAELRQKEMIGTFEDVFMPVEPECVVKSATLPLKADEWTSDVPPQITDDQAREMAVLSGRAD